MRSTAAGHCKPLDAQYGRLRIVGREGHFALCVCECGTSRRVDTARLRSGATKSCGCLARELVARRGRTKVTHGMSLSTEYVIWQKMINRCHKPSSDNYARYGARGIQVCERWLASFENFYADMGPRPSTELTLDRRDNSLGYFKENCRWATRMEQSRNNRRNHSLTAFGETKLICEWLEDSRCSVRADTLRGRIRRGFDAEWSIAAPAVDTRANLGKYITLAKVADAAIHPRRGKR